MLLNRGHCAHLSALQHRPFIVAHFFGAKYSYASELPLTRDSKPIMQPNLIPPLFARLVSARRLRQISDA